MRGPTAASLLGALAHLSQLAHADPIEPFAQSTTGTFEVDLVFPLHGATYPASSRLPIVFAFHNTGLARFLDSSYTIHLKNSQHILEFQNTQRLLPDDIAFDDPSFSYIGYDYFGWEAFDHWTLNWTFTYTSCEPPRSANASGPAQLVTNATHGGAITFSTGSRDAKFDIAAALQDIAGGASSAGGVAIDVTSVVDGPGDDGPAAAFGWGKCAVVGGARAVRESPSLAVGADAAKTMADVIRKRSCVTLVDGELGCEQNGALGRGVPVASGVWAAAVGGLAYFLLL